MSKNHIDIVKEILQDEINGNTKAALAKMHPDYTMTWMSKTQKGTLFLREKVTRASDIEDVYTIKNRTYDIKHITEDATQNTVMVELIESYPDPETGKMFVTPLVLVLEFEGDLIIRGRHYYDPDVSAAFVSKEEVAKLYK